MPTQTYSITAPNGKSLDVTGDHVPTESELKDIFKAAGVSTESSGSPSDQAPSFVPSTAKEFATRMGNAAIDVPIGMAKQMGRYAQMVPGVATVTDKVFGLPSGASEKAMQPTNPSQTAGGYVADLAIGKGAGNVGTAGKVWSNANGWVDNPTVAEKAGAAIKNTADAIRAKLTSGGPVTAEKAADLIVEYGKDAVKLALVGMGGGAGYAAWRAVRHLF